MINFTFKGCKVSISVGFFALITLMMITSEAQIVFCSLICSLFHEAGHIVAMIFFGERLCRLKLSAFGIAIERTGMSSLGYTQEAIVSLAGIAFNIILAVAAYFLGSVCNLQSMKSLCAVSLIVGTFNLLPIDSLDGAAALRFVILKKYDERQANFCVLTLSFICTGLLLILAVMTLICAKANFSLIAAVIYLAALLASHLIEGKRSC